MQNPNAVTNQEKAKIKASIAAMEIKVSKNKEIKEFKDFWRAVEGFEYIDIFDQQLKHPICSYYIAVKKNGEYSQDVILVSIEKKKWYKKKKGQLEISSTKDNVIDNYIKQITGITEQEIIDIKNEISKIQEKDESSRKEKIAKIIMDKEIRKSLERELEMFIKCKPDNIVSCSGFFEAKDFVVFELEGDYDDNLKEYLKNYDKLSDDKDKYKQIFSGIIGALKELKSKKIIHRDIRPSNILYNKDMKIKLKGFEYAIYTNDSDAEKGHCVCRGYNYVAPEVIHDREGYNEKSDLWSAGIVLHELYFGNLPYNSDVNIKITNNAIAKCTDTQKAFGNKYKKVTELKEKSPILALILQGLLQVDPKLRLSCEQLFELAEYDIFSKTQDPRTEDFIKKYDEFMKQNEEKKKTDLKENLKQNEELEQHKIENNEIKITSIHDQNNINTDYNNSQNNETKISQIVSCGSSVQDENKYESPKKIITFNWIQFLKLLAVVLIFSAVIFVALKFIFDITTIWVLVVFPVVPTIIFLLYFLVSKNKFRKGENCDFNITEISMHENNEKLLSPENSLKTKMNLNDNGLNGSPIESPIGEEG